MMAVIFQSSYDWREIMPEAIDEGLAVKLFCDMGFEGGNGEIR